MRSYVSVPGGRPYDCVIKSITETLLVYIAAKPYYPSLEHCV